MRLILRVYMLPNWYMTVTEEGPVSPWFPYRAAVGYQSQEGAAVGVLIIDQFET